MLASVRYHKLLVYRMISIRVSYNLVAPYWLQSVTVDDQEQDQEQDVIRSDFNLILHGVCVDNNYSAGSSSCSVCSRHSAAFKPPSRNRHSASLLAAWQHRVCRYIRCGGRCNLTFPRYQLSYVNRPSTPFHLRI
jgi:hypothetical protein